ncbi:MAG: winged helix-turn-helix transcriptional regulator [Rhizobiaceae bacterium]|nr:winged helix-turn-helix transcriptional regulator [Rhizobiaceae bacterium]
MITIKQRYLAFNFIPPFAMSAFFFVAFLLTFQLFRLTRIITQKGVDIAIIADKIKRAVPQAPNRVLLRRAWTIPVLVMSQQPRYFSEISNGLVSISDRALSQSLKQLQAQKWLHRKIDAEIYPPRPLYQATNAGVLIGQAVGLEVF